MNYVDILNGAWLLLKIANEEWGIFTPDIPNIQMTDAQIKQYKDLKIRHNNRLERTLQLAEIEARLDLLYVYADIPGFQKAIKAFEKTINHMKSNRIKL